MEDEDCDINILIIKTSMTTIAVALIKASNSFSNMSYGSGHGLGSWLNWTTPSIGPKMNIDGSFNSRREI